MRTLFHTVFKLGSGPARVPSAPLPLTYWVCGRCYSSLAGVNGAGAHAAPLPQASANDDSSSEDARLRPRSTRKPFYVHSPVTESVSSITKLLAEQTDLQKAKDIFQFYKDNNQLHWSVFGTYVPLLTKHKEFDEAVNVMRDAIHNCMVHPHLYNMFLHILVREHLDDLALTFLKEIRYTPYQSLIDTWMQHLTNKSSKLSMAKELAFILTRSTSTSYVNAYSKIFTAYLRYNQPEECLAIVQDCIKANDPLPDTYIFRLLNYLLITSPNTDLLLKLVDITSTDTLLSAVAWYRSSRGLLPHVVSILDFILKHFPDMASDYFRNLSVSNFVKIGDLVVEYLKKKQNSKKLELREEDSLILSAIAVLPDMGEELLDRMLARNVTIHPIYYEYKLWQLTQASTDPEAALELYVRAMTKHGVKPSKLMSKSVILAFLRADKLQRAQELFKWMKSEQLDLEGIHICFAIYYVNHRQPQEAINVLLKTMPEDNVKPSLNEYNNVVEALGKNGFLGPARIICRAMRDAGQKPNATTHFYMLRNTIAHEGAEDAFILLDRMRNKWHVTPDKRIYAMVLEKIIEANHLDKVEELRDLMRKDKIILDMDMYNLLLEAYLKLNDETGSSRLLKRLSAVGLTPTPETYKLLLRHYTTTKKIEKILSIVREIQNGQNLLLPRVKIEVVKGLLVADRLDIGFDMIAWDVIHLRQQRIINRDVCDILLFAVCYAKHYDLASKILRKCKEVNFLPTQSVINMVLERMRVDKYDHTSLAAELGVTPSPLPSSPLSPSLSSPLSPPSPLPAPPSLSPPLLPSISLSSPSAVPPPVLLAADVERSNSHVITPAPAFSASPAPTFSASPAAVSLSPSPTVSLSPPPASLPPAITPSPLQPPVLTPPTPASSPLPSPPTPLQTAQPHIPSISPLTPSAPAPSLTRSLSPPSTPVPPPASPTPSTPPSPAPQKRPIFDLIHYLNPFSHLFENQRPVYPAGHVIIEDVVHRRYSFEPAAPKKEPTREASYEFVDELASVRECERMYPSNSRASADPFKLAIFEEIDENEEYAEDEWEWAEEEEEEEKDEEKKAEKETRRDNRLREMILSMKLW